jgi:uncharacterized protein YlbG (UPF0298 family)
MTTIKYTVGFVNMNSLDELVDKLNSLDDVKCTIAEKNITSALLSIELSNEPTLEDVLSLGSLIGIIQTSSLI